jgi:hypothetical protein
VGLMEGCVCQVGRIGVRGGCMHGYLDLLGGWQGGGADW